MDLCFLQQGWSIRVGWPTCLMEADGKHHWIGPSRHLVISAAIQITIQEGRLPVANSLSKVMVDARLWNPSQFPAVAGGVILLIAR